MAQEATPAGALAPPTDAAEDLEVKVESGLDMFVDFTDKLRRVFAGGPLTEEDVAKLLCLEKGQAKLWLKRASESGAVEKLKKPVRYAMGRQGTLC